MIPNPTPATRVSARKALTEHPYTYRRLYCVYYDDCLEQAIAGRWENFTCRACAIRREIPAHLRRVQGGSILAALASMDLGEDLFEFGAAEHLPGEHVDRVYSPCATEEDLHQEDRPKAKVRSAKLPLDEEEGDQDSGRLPEWEVGAEEEAL